MIDHRVIEILKTFSMDDIKAFKDFLNSPYFNKSLKLVKFFEALIKYYPDFNKKSFSKEILNKKVNPDLPFNNLTMNRLFFDLLKAAEKYLMFVNIQKKELEVNCFLRDELFKRKLFRVIEINIKNAKKKLKNCSDVTSDYYYDNFRLFTDIVNLNNINKGATKSSLISANINQLTEQGKYLTYFFIMEMIANYENLIVYNKTFHVNKNSNFVYLLFDKIDFSWLLKFMMQHTSDESSKRVFEIYHALFMTISNFDDEKYYYGYKKLLLKNLQILSLHEKSFHFGNLIYYCMMKREISKLAVKFDLELFNIYKYILQNSYYKTASNEYLPVGLFRSILILALRLKKYQWSVNFIKIYSNFLRPDKKRNMYCYGLARYYFSRKMYKPAVINLHNVSVDNFIFKLDLRNIMLITYYELKEFEAALSLTDSYFHFLTKDKTLSVSQRKRYKNFVILVQKMILYKTSAYSVSKYYIDKIFSKDLPFKEWINEKYLELEKYKKAI